MKVLILSLDITNSIISLWNHIIDPLRCICLFSPLSLCSFGKLKCSMSIIVMTNYPKIWTLIVIQNERVINTCRPLYLFSHFLFWTFGGLACIMSNTCRPTFLFSPLPLRTFGGLTCIMSITVMAHYPKIKNLIVIQNVCMCAFAPTYTFTYGYGCVQIISRTYIQQYSCCSHSGQMNPCYLTHKVTCSFFDTMTLDSMDFIHCFFSMG